MLSLAEKEVLCSRLQPEACMDTRPCLWDSGVCRAFRPPPRLDFPHVCNDGAQAAECFDVDECAKGAPGPSKTKRWAFVFTHSLQKKLERLPEKAVAPLRQLAKELGNTDLVLLVPQLNARLNGLGAKVEPESFTEEDRRAVEEQGVKVVVVPWAIPPKMKWVPTWPWCGGKDLLRLHLFNMIDYDMAAYFDTDTQLTGRGDPTIPFRCVAKGPEGGLLAAAGTFSALNMGYVVVKPSRALFEASVNFAELADYDPLYGEGWGSAGIAPFKAARGTPHEYPGSECGQGFLHTLLYKHPTPKVTLAFQMAGSSRPPARMLDRCIWNFQSEQYCREREEDVDCSKVVMVHKNGTYCLQH